MKVRPHIKRYIKTAVFVTAATAFLLTGCGRRIDYGLPENPNKFHTGTFVNPDDPDDTYQSIEYNGRTYIGYGTLKGAIDGDDVGQCLGYVILDGAAMKKVRIFLLNADPDANYLVQIFTDTFMNQPFFFRALDTRGKQIGTPQYIESLDYPYWK